MAALNQTVLADDKLRKAFEMLDKDGDGLVSREDLNKALDFYLGDNEKRGPEGEGKSLFLDADKDGDGYLSYDEFIGMLLTNADLSVDC